MTTTATGYRVTSDYQVGRQLRELRAAGDDIDRQVAAEADCARCGCRGLRLVLRGGEKYTRCPGCGRMEAL